jgi:hypothetical protein
MHAAEKLDFVWFPNSWGDKMGTIHAMLGLIFIKLVLRHASIINWDNIPNLVRLWVDFQILDRLIFIKYFLCRASIKNRHEHSKF